jgi:hypothetical protein
MPIEFVASSCKISSTATLTLQLNRPLTTQNSDVLVAIVCRYYGGTPITGPSNWYQAVFKEATSGDDRAFGIWYKVITNVDGEPVSYTWTGTNTASAWSAGMMVLRNVDTLNPYGISACTLTSSDITPDCPSIIPPVVNSFIITCADVTQTATSVTPPVDTTPLWKLFVTQANSMCSYYIQPGASGTGTRTWTTNATAGAENAAAQISFNPLPSTMYKTRILDTNKLTWHLDYGMYGIASSMSSISPNTTTWSWSTIVSSSIIFYPSGGTKWINVSGTAGNN